MKVVTRIRKARKHLQKAIADGTLTIQQRETLEALAGDLVQAEVEIWSYSNSNRTGEQKEPPIGPINSY